MTLYPVIFHGSPIGYEENCYLCPEPLYDPVEMDHVLPRTRSRGDTPLMPVHAHCNRIHRDYPIFLILASEEEKRKWVGRITTGSEKWLKAKAEGRVGRKKTLTDERIAEAQRLRRDGVPVGQIAEKLQTPRGTLYRYLQGIKPDQPNPVLRDEEGCYTTQANEDWDKLREKVRAAIRNAQENNRGSACI
jgi:Helix-turn-helix domain of resolvase